MSALPWLDPFIGRAALAGLGVAAAAGPLGAFVLWRRMAYFGDATAHASLLGLALAVLAGLPGLAGVAAVAVVAALIASRGSRAQAAIGADARLGVIAHGALALGLIAVSAVPGRRLSLEAALMGDILSVTGADIATAWAVAALVLLLLWQRWRALVVGSLSADLAAADGHHPGRDDTLLALALALVVAASIKVVGVLLVAAMLVIPAVGARALARSPEGMAALAALLAALAVLGGLGLSLLADTPAGPSIVAAALALALLAAGAAAARRS
ncbi:MAG: hypothetical protein D6832_00620 [Alphaproteobacteria bacterium]|nr:MAG: hypothetical protein D6832_00620 [Alphaproteobacteria bacterium]